MDHFDADPDSTYHPDADPGFQVKAQTLETKIDQIGSFSIILACHLQIDPDPAYHFHADPDPDFYLMRTFTKMMRIYADWIRIHNTAYKHCLIVRYPVLYPTCRMLANSTACQCPEESPSWN